jgi:hypothetical protein
MVWPYVTGGFHRTGRSSEDMIVAAVEGAQHLTMVEKEKRLSE